MTGREPASVGQTGVMTLVGDHRRAAEGFARELSERREVEVALFHGSAVRGEAVEGSDVDLLGVTGEEDLELGRFHHRDGLVVDLVIHGCVGGLERLGRRARCGCTRSWRPSRWSTSLSPYSPTEATAPPSPADNDPRIQQERRPSSP
jgi:predicted nucleotidyltransferase